MNSRTPWGEDLQPGPGPRNAPDFDIILSQPLLSSPINSTLFLSLIAGVQLVLLPSRTQLLSEHSQYTCATLAPSACLPSSCLPVLGDSPPTAGLGCSTALFHLALPFPDGTCGPGLYQCHLLVGLLGSSGGRGACDCLIVTVCPPLHSAHS